MTKKKIIGYTTGVFDLFHIGHLNIIKKAKKKCDYLIVAISSDELCFKLKKKKPVIPFEERIEIIKSIKFVDRVVIEKKNDKLEALKRYKFDIIFKGNDHKNSKNWLIWHDEFKKKKIKVVFFNYTKNTSSTLIKNVCKKIVRKN